MAEIERACGFPIGLLSKFEHQLPKVKEKVSSGGWGGFFSVIRPLVLPFRKP
jgi:hypothetical protein